MVPPRSLNSPIFPIVKIESIDPIGPQAVFGIIAAMLGWR
jgi:hypothetical protein